MRMCKRWDDAVKNTVSTMTDQVSSRGCDDVDNMIYDNGGISDSCLAALQTIEPVVYKQTREGNNSDHYYKINRLLTCVYKK
ncbi:hypothetical protein Hanom_Chr03g00209841 [Helianthus anomalus]